MTKGCSRNRRTRRALSSLSVARAAIAGLKQNLIAPREAGALFGQEREAGLESIFGNLEQNVLGEPIL